MSALVWQGAGDVIPLHVKVCDGVHGLPLDRQAAWESVEAQVCHAEQGQLIGPGRRYGASQVCKPAAIRFWNSKFDFFWTAAHHHCHHALFLPTGTTWRPHKRPIANDFPVSQLATWAHSTSSRGGPKQNHDTQGAKAEAECLFCHRWAYVSILSTCMCVNACTIHPSTTAGQVLIMYWLQRVTHPSVSTSSLVMLLEFLPQVAGIEPPRRQFLSSASRRSAGNAPLSAHSLGSVPCQPEELHESPAVMSAMNFYFYFFRYDLWFYIQNLGQILRFFPCMIWEAATAQPWEPVWEHRSNPKALVAVAAKVWNGTASNAFFPGRGKVRQTQGASAANGYYYYYSRFSCQKQGASADKLQ